MWGVPGGATVVERHVSCIVFRRRFGVWVELLRVRAPVRDRRRREPVVRLVPAVLQDSLESRFLNCDTSTIIEDSPPQRSRLAAGRTLDAGVSDDCGAGVRRHPLILAQVLACGDEHLAGCGRVAGDAVENLEPGNVDVPVLVPAARAVPAIARSSATRNRTTAARCALWFDHDHAPCIV